MQFKYIILVGTLLGLICASPRGGSPLRTTEEKLHPSSPLEIPIAEPIKPVKTTEDIRKSPFDSSSYRHITLENGLEALLISSPNTLMSSAALDVRAGSSQDPDELPGLAHLTEHMLFLGTEKYPNESEYHEFIKMHGGYRNADTEDEHTRYFFDIGSNHFEPALDRFSRFFIDPLFNEDCMERELNVIESEFQLRRSRLEQSIAHVMKALCKDHHPFARFSMGNIETLKTIPEAKGINVRERLINFYETFYSADVMKLTVYGKESLDELEEMVVEKFSSIVNRNIKIQNYPGPPIHPNNLQKVIMIDSNLEIQAIMLRWELPGVHDCSYQVSLFNRSGTGSLRKYLSKLEGFSSMMAVSDTSHGGFTILQVLVAWSSVTSETLLSAIETIFAYIKMINDAGAQKAYHDELLSLHELNFNLDLNSTLVDVTKRAAQLLHYYEPRNILWGRQTDEFDPEKIQFVTDQLRLDNCIILKVAPIPEDCTAETSYLGTKFIVDSLSKVQGIVEDPVFGMPQPNRYVSQIPDLNTARVPIETQELRITDGPIKYWFTLNDPADPKTAIDIVFTTHRSKSSVQHYIRTMLFVKMFFLEYSDLTNEATAANLRFNVTSDSRGIIFSFSGVREMLAPYLYDMLKKMLNFVPTNQAHLNIAKVLLKDQINASSNDPESLIALYWDLLSEVPCWPRQLEDELRNVNIEDLTGYGRELFSEGSLHVHHKGRVTIKDLFALDNGLTEISAEMKPYLRYEGPKARVAVLPPGQSLVFYRTTTSSDSGVGVYIQTGSSCDPKTRGFTSLLAGIIDGSFFGELRTKQQLAYYLSANLREDHSSTGIRFEIRSSMSPIDLEGKIEEYIGGELLRRVMEMSVEDFEGHKQTVSYKMLTRDVDPFDLWIPVGLDGEALHYVQRASLQDLHTFFTEHFLPSSPERCKLSIHIWGSAVEDQLESAYSRPQRGVSYFDDPDELRKFLDYSPLPKGPFDVDGQY